MKKIKLIFLFLISILILLLFFYKDIYRSLSYEKRNFIKKLFLSERQILLKPLQKNQLTLPNTYFTKINIDKIKLPNIYNTLQSNNKAVGYIDHDNEYIYFVSGAGDFLKINITDLIDKKNTFLKIINNFKEINKENKLLLDSSKKIRINHKVAVNDILIDKENFYVSYTANKGDCYYNKIVFADLREKVLNFKNIFDPVQCIKIEDDFSKFNAQAAGGRLIIKNNKIYLTTGTFLKNNLAQQDNSIFGKVLEIDINSGDYEIYAKGFRNPQGLIEYQNNLFLTEHGPYGGDEINKLIKNNNYGWNIASYGRKYRAKYEEKYFFEDHRNFKEPIFSFVPSIGISQIIPAFDFEKRWKNDLLTTSLNGRSIFRLSFDDQKERLISYERIFVGERIRDIIYLSKLKKFLIVFEESASIGIMSNLN